MANSQGTAACRRHRRHEHTVLQQHSCRHNQAPAHLKQCCAAHVLYSSAKACIAWAAVQSFSTDCSPHTHSWAWLWLPSARTASWLTCMPLVSVLQCTGGAWRHTQQKARRHTQCIWHVASCQALTTHTVPYPPNRRHTPPIKSPAVQLPRTGGSVLLSHWDGRRQMRHANGTGTAWSYPLSYAPITLSTLQWRTQHHMKYLRHAQGLLIHTLS